MSTWTARPDSGRATKFSRLIGLDLLEWRYRADSSAKRGSCRAGAGKKAMSECYPSIIHPSLAVVFPRHCLVLVHGLCEHTFCFVRCSPAKPTRRSSPPLRQFFFFLLHTDCWPHLSAKRRPLYITRKTATNAFPAGTLESRSKFSLTSSRGLRRSAEGSYHLERSATTRGRRAAIP